MADTNSGSDGIGFVGLLTLLCITLKLLKVITWSWLWVLAPVWIVGGLTIFILLVIGLIMLALD